MSTNSTEKWSWQTWQHQHSLLSYKLSSPETHRCLNRCRYTLILQCSLFPTPKWRLPHHNGYYQQQKLHLMDISLCFCRALNFRINRNGQGEKLILCQKSPLTLLIDDLWSNQNVAKKNQDWLLKLVEQCHSNVICIIYT